MEANKKAFTLVELLVAMAIIAILLGLAVFGISVVQQNARDTQRRAKINDFEIALNGLLTSSAALPTDLSTGDNASSTDSVEITDSMSISLDGSLVRGSDFTTATTASVTNYCYGQGGTTYVVGVQLEGGGWYFKTNTGQEYTEPGTTPAPGCVDANL
jgi:prepilin-type N-terminal cleavage/methylation domain-containing protein